MPHIYDRVPHNAKVLIDKFCLNVINKYRYTHAWARAHPHTHNEKVYFSSDNPVKHVWLNDMDNNDYIIHVMDNNDYII